MLRMSIGTWGTSLRGGTVGKRGTRSNGGKAAPQHSVDDHNRPCTRFLGLPLRSRRYLKSDGTCLWMPPVAGGLHIERARMCFLSESAQRLAACSQSSRRPEHSQAPLCRSQEESCCLPSLLHRSALQLAGDHSRLAASPPSLHLVSPAAQAQLEKLPWIDGHIGRWETRRPPVPDPEKLGRPDHVFQMLDAAAPGMPGS